MASKRKRLPPIHQSIKERLGYGVSDPDNDVYEDWKERTSRVCKPCWELKYCPYGPLVEQSPLLPPERSSGIDRQQEYFKRCLETDTVGEITPLTEDFRSYYEEWIQDEQVLFRQALTEIKNRERFAKLAEIEGDDEQIEAWIGRLPPIHIYRVRYDLGLNQEVSFIEEKDFAPEIWQEILKLAEDKREKYKLALATGEIDNRGPLEPTRRAWFKKQIEEFNPDEYPEHVPKMFSEASCSIFGHICPVFFVAEALTETEEERRIGRRHLSFTTMMRIVRRDDYRCQHCQKKLEDTEVEFDHIIPISKGGSSEEHNLRLTCFDCNRDKSDDYVP